MHWIKKLKHGIVIADMSPDKTLINYITEAKKMSIPEADIRMALEQKGWAVADINSAFSYIFLLSNTPSPVSVPEIPVPSPHHGQPSITKERIIPQTKPAAIVSKNPQKQDYDSPYSVALGILVFLSLLLLINKIIDNVSMFSDGVNQKLIWDALVVVPFLATAFLLYQLLAKDQKYFLVLSKPYFVASGLLIIRLLWDTSWYVLSASATYGIYIVLVMVIAVLTGIIIFVRKYMVE